MTTDVALNKALQVCNRFPVFPLKLDKSPATKRGFKDAVQSPAEVVELWRKHPGVLIGVPTGEVSGINVLDIDPRHDGQIWYDEAKDSLPITRTHQTRSGGWHILFRHDPIVKNTAGRIGRGIDTRGTGGYIVLWSAEGYQVDNPRILADWPRWLLNLLAPPARPRIPIFTPATRQEADSRAALMIERAYDRVRNAQPGQRHFQLRAAGATLGGLARFINKSSRQIEDDLVTLIMQTGGEDRANAEKTARWAVQRGACSPLLANVG